jgi:Uma2 family endonuclease
MTVHAPVTMSKEAFLAWIERREERYEYAGGRVIMMVGITRNRAQAMVNLALALRQRLPVGQYDVATEGFGIDVGESFRFPDVVVEPTQTDGKALKAKSPILIAEVLSPSTLHIDFGDKRQEYLSLPTLDTYLIVSPDEPRAWIWQRTDDEFPTEPDIIEGVDKQITLPALGVEIALGEIYRGIL